MAPCPLRGPEPQQAAQRLPVRLLHGQHAERERRQGQRTAAGAVPGDGESIGAQVSAVPVRWKCPDDFCNRISGRSLMLVMK